MLITPIKPKAVSFQLPGHKRAATAPPRVLRHTLQSPPSPHSTSATRSPQPDLIAHLIDQSKAVHPNKIKALSKHSNTTVESPTQGWLVSQYTTTKRINSPEVVTMKEVIPGSGEKMDQKIIKPKQDRRITSGQAKVSKVKSIRGHRMLTGSVQHGGKLTQTSQVTRMAYRVREQTNVSCLEHVRWMKHDVAKLREHLVKIDDEIKLANKAKVFLDTKIFDLRKCLSVNQQSVTAQQKRSHREVCSSF